MKLKVELLRKGAKVPHYAKDLDVGADVFLPEGKDIVQGVSKIPLGIAVHIPNGYVGFVCPRSGTAGCRGLTTEIVPIDPSYTGEIHIIMNNTTGTIYRARQHERLAQLVIVPAVRAQFVVDELEQRGTKAFNSTGE